jgi:hypothetical protein
MLSNLEKNNFINIFFLPLDNRPCSYKYILEFFNILYKQKEQNKQKEQFNIDFYWDFNFNNLISKSKLDVSNSCNVYILSLDALLFGDLVNSRSISSTKNYQKKINGLIDFIKSKKSSYFYFYISIPRIILNLENTKNQNLNNSDYEKIIDYNKIIEINFKLSKKIRNIFKNYQYKKFNEILKLLKNLIKKSNLNYYKMYYKVLKNSLITRKNKFNLIKFLLNRLYFLKKRYNLSNFELVISLDDSQKKALNFLELDFFKNYLKKKIKDIFNKVYFFIGLDEIHLILFAKAFLNIFNIKNLEINIFFNNKIDKKIGRYEGKSLKEILKIYSNFFKNYINFNFIDNLKEITLKKNNLQDYLFINLFNNNYCYQKESIKQIFDLLDKFKEKFYILSNEISFEDFLKYFIIYFKDAISYDILKYDILKNVKFLCDIEYSNGPSLELLSFFLFNHKLLIDLKLYFSWNTLANSLGSTLSFFILYKIFNIQDTKELKEFVLSRFLEGVYQSFIRYFAKKNSWDVIKIKEAFLKILNSFNIKDIKIQSIDLPWNRYFEIDVSVSLKEKDF